MRHLAKLALALSLLAPLAADAKPRKSSQSAAWMSTCIHERTGPVGGISQSEARAICTAENPHSKHRADDPAVALAKRELASAKLQLRIAKATARAARAIELCEEAILVACEDTTERATDRGECDADKLSAQLAQCRGGK